ncbi:MAG: RT0821/Lpp0805 family surface protein [Gammaproteobacteria bacterium]
MKAVFVGALLVVAAGQAALAQNIEFLHRGPIAYMDEIDKQILTDTVNAALGSAADGEKVKWSNPDSGSHGTIEVLDTHEDYGTTCRTVRTHSEAGGREGGGIYRLCLADDDTWQFAPRRRQASGN